MTLRPIPHALALAGAITLLAACGAGGGDIAGNGTSRPQAASSVALPPAPTGLSGNVTCNNWTIIGGSLDSVIVPANAACRLEGTSLNGSIIVGAGATLAASAINTRGSLQADGAAHVALTGNSRITGAVQIKQGGSAQISGNVLTGDIQVDVMRAAVLVGGNQIGGNIQAVGNFGGATITGNMVKGSLQCKENTPAPVAGGNVAASIEDQCVAAAAGGGSGGGVGGGGTTPPLSGTVTCVGLRIGAIALDSVVVPDNASCALEGTRLVGTLQVGANASVTAIDVRVNGSVQAERAASVLIGGASSVGGSVQLKDGAAATVSGADITGDLQIDAMRGPVAASGNRIAGNLQAMANRGGVSLSANTIGGAMQCKDNLPAPAGSGNVASITEDQCRPL